MRGRTVVITGGAGFIGSNLAEALSRENDVTVIDNLSTGKLENIRPLVKSKRVRFVRGSAADPKLMKKVCRGADYLLHYAAIPSVIVSVNDPLAVNRSGVDSALTALVAARDTDIDKFVLASSSAVYGDTKSLPTKEDTPLSPLSPYAVTKIAGEWYCKVFSELYGLETVALRFFNVFGPRQDPKGEYAAVIPRFVTNALAGRKLTVYGDGRQTRDFLFVEDVVRANELAVRPGVKGVYNISSGRAVSINVLANIVVLLSGRHVPVVHEAPRPGEIQRSHADISKARRELGFEPAFTLEDGLRKTIAAFSAQPSKRKR